MACAPEQLEYFHIFFVEAGSSELYENRQNSLIIFLGQQMVTWLACHCIEHIFDFLGLSLSNLVHKYKMKCKTIRSNFFIV